MTRGLHITLPDGIPALIVVTPYPTGVEGRYGYGAELRSPDDRPLLVQFHPEEHYRRLVYLTAATGPDVEARVVQRVRDEAAKIIAWRTRRATTTHPEETP